MAVGSRDHYDVLGVARGADEKDIRAAYRRLARENHPDVNKSPDAEDRFKEVSEAWDVLRDPEKRGLYDQYGADWRAVQQAGGAPPGGGRAGRGAPRGGRGGGGGGFEGFDPSDFGGYDDVRVDFGGGGGGGFEDIFEGLFGGGRGRRGPAPPARGNDQEAVVELSLEEAFAGGRRKIRLADGRDYEVTIPPGIRDGQLIRLAGEGGPGGRGGSPGDLLLRVHIRPHPLFRLDGADIEVDLRIAPWEGALGASVPVPTLEGDATLSVPPGSSSGRRLRLRGQGLRRPDGERGDLHAVVMIMVPRSLGDEERELYERLRDVSDFDPRRGT
jgi:curved DNA-binding protein